MQRDVERNGEAKGGGARRGHRRHARPVEAGLSEAMGKGRREVQALRREAGGEDFRAGALGGCADGKGEEAEAVMVPLMLMLVLIERNLMCCGDTELLPGKGARSKLRNEFLLTGCVLL